QHQRVYGREHTGEIIEQVAGTAVAVRLECDDDTFVRPATTGRGEHRLQFLGVVAVVVDHRHHAAAWQRRLRQQVEASSDAGETFQRPRDHFRLDAQLPA